MISRRGRAARVSTYLGPRTFYEKDMARRHRAGQTDDALPPRCRHCRVSWGVVVLHGSPHCETHAAGCLAGCADDEDNLGETG